MKINREGLAHAYRRAKNIGVRAFNTMQKVLHTTDKLAYLGARGLLALGPRLDPEFGRQAGRALQTYSAGKDNFNNTVENAGKVNQAFKNTIV